MIHENSSLSNNVKGLDCVGENEKGTEPIEQTQVFQSGGRGSEKRH